MELIIAAVLGFILGHGIRRLSPHVLNMKDTKMPFGFVWVELLTALVFVLIAMEGDGFPFRMYWGVLALFLMIIGTADAHTKYVPVMPCYVGTGIGLLLAVLFPAEILNLLSQESLASMVGVPRYQTHGAGAVMAISGAVMGYLQIWFIRRVFKPLVKIEVMGSGDSLIMMTAGAFLGPQGVLFALLPACLIGSVVGTIRLVIYKVHHSAFGPSLAAGALGIALYGDNFVGWVKGFNQWLYGLPPMALMGFSLFLIGILLFMVLRLKRKGVEYERAIEDDYQAIDQKMKK